MKDPNYQNIYCLVHAERLSYQVCEAAFKEYDSLSQGVNGNYCMHVHLRISTILEDNALSICSYLIMKQVFIATSNNFYSSCINIFPFYNLIV